MQRQGFCLFEKWSTESPAAICTDTHKVCEHLWFQIWPTDLPRPLLITCLNLLDEKKQGLDHGYARRRVICKGPKAFPRQGMYIVWAQVLLLKSAKAFLQRQGFCFLRNGQQNLLRRFVQIRTNCDFFWFQIWPMDLPRPLLNICFNLLDEKKQVLDDGYARRQCYL